MKRFIVTGGSGFIGYHLAEYLSRQSENEITVIDNHTRGIADDMFNRLIERQNVVFINEDMTKKEFYNKLSGYYDGIYHWAALNGTKNFYDRPYEVMRINILTLMNMLEWCNSQNCGAFLFSSSSETYAGTFNCFLSEHTEFVPTKEDIPLTVDDIFNPRWSYGGSKITGELLVSNYCHTNNISFKIIRYHNVYGIRMGYDHVLPEFFKRIYNKVDPFPIFGGEETRAFCAVEDAVKATESVMLSARCNGEIIHIGNSNQEIKIIDLLKMVLNIADFHPVIDIKSAPQGCVMRRCPNTDKLFNLTGFKAKIKLEEALPKMLKWYVDIYQKLEKDDKGNVINNGK